MAKTEVVENKLEIIVKAEDFGLETSKAKEIELGFSPSIEKLNELKPEYDLIIQKEMSPELVDEAKELRLKFVKIRTGTEKIHKTLKAFYLAGGKFVDAWKNKQLEISIQVEDRLKEIETHYERIEERKKEERRTLRLKQLEGIKHSGEGLDLLDMDDNTWNAVIKGLEVEYKERIEAQEKAEAERIAKEKADAEALEKARIENEKLKAEAIEREKKVESERKKQEAKLVKEKAKREAERKAQEEKLAEERKKAEAERKAIEEKARKEREKAESERRKAEEKARKEKEAERAKAEAERKEKERLAELLKNQIVCPKCGHKFQIKEK